MTLPEHPSGQSGYRRLFEVVALVIVVLSILVLVLDSVRSFQTSHGHLFARLEVFFSVFFVLEYILRIAMTQWSGRSWNKAAKYLFSFYGLLDLVCLIPVLFTGIDVSHASAGKTLRLLRVLRLLKVTRHSKGLQLLGKAIANACVELISTLAAALFVILFSSVIIYQVEHDVQPEVFSSIPAAFWWAVATLTTVGYGDIYPVTDLGKVFASVVALVGIGLVAIPTGVIVASYNEVRKQS